MRYNEQHPTFREMKMLLLRDQYYGPNHFQMEWSQGQVRIRETRPRLVSWAKCYWSEPWTIHLPWSGVGRTSYAPSDQVTFNETSKWWDMGGHRKSDLHSQAIYRGFLSVYATLTSSALSYLPDKKKQSDLTIYLLYWVEFRVYVIV